MSNSPLCIGGYSALPSANLLSLGIMQAGLPSALAKPQLCSWSFNCGVSIDYWLCWLMSNMQNVYVNCSDSKNTPDCWCVQILYIPILLRASVVAICDN